MNTLTLSEARQTIRDMVIAIYAEDPIATQFLSSFFRMVESRSKTVSIEVQRMSEAIAVDVLRGTQGQRNSFDKFSVKKWEPPYFREWLDATSLDFYDVLFAQVQGEITAQVVAEMSAEIARRLRTLQAKIMRTKERMASQVLHTGIVTLSSGDNIDYKRDANSIVDLGATNYWADSGVNFETAIIDGLDFVREKGKGQGDFFNMIAGKTAISDLLRNQAFIDASNFRRVDRVSLNAPQRVSDGKIHGEFTAGDRQVRLWSYSEVFDDPTSSLSTPYVVPKKIIILPETPNFVYAHAAVPVRMRLGTDSEFIAPVPGEFVFGDYIDPVMEKHVFDVKSAPLPVPVAIDQIYTAQVVA